MRWSTDCLGSAAQCLAVIIMYARLLDMPCFLLSAVLVGVLSTFRTHLLVFALCMHRAHMLHHIGHSH